VREQILLEHVLIAPALRVHEERVAAVRPDHEELRQALRAEIREDRGEPAAFPEAGALEEAVQGT
jgi:hypothetical protein